MSKSLHQVSPADININESINILGIEILSSPFTRDDDLVISNGIQSNRQVEMRGFIDSQGQIFAQSIKDKGDEDFDDVSIRGDITEINQPFISINGSIVDATSSLFELEDGQVTLEQFFGFIEIGMQIKIEEASYDKISNVLSLGEIEIEEQELEDDPENENSNFQKNRNREIIGTGGIGIATVSSTEMIFRSEFE